MAFNQGVKTLYDRSNYFLVVDDISLYMSFVPSFELWRLSFGFIPDFIGCFP